MSLTLLRLYRDRLVRDRPRALPAANRVLYAQQDAVRIAQGGVTARLAGDSAWQGAGACTVGSDDDAATVLRWELVEPASARDGDLVLEQGMDLAADAAWLMRCDRVDFDPGGVALPHRHRGGGIRCLVAGTLEVTVGDAAPRLVRPGEAWFESGREPVLARASATDPTSFIRVAILPAEIRGQTSIVYVDPADAARGRPRRYTVWIDAPITVS